MEGFLPNGGGYKALRAYVYSEAIYDLTKSLQGLSRSKNSNFWSQVEFGSRYIKRELIIETRIERINSDKSETSDQSDSPTGWKRQTGPTFNLQLKTKVYGNKSFL